MKVLIGAIASWLIIGLLLGATLFVLTTKGMIWPFALSLLFVMYLIKRFGCSTH
ncbi:MAG: hypothetical protein HYR88_01910 [Verrucomicrobia bacterium]|nr:hypothetical protein [Verrucomicrobiota bacterium]MBI3870768.1 hypothetical protein [Verrucomicrobiota bacterium]